MQSVSSKIWTRVAVSISYDDNDYTTGTSWWVGIFSSFEEISQEIHASVTLQMHKGMHSVTESPFLHLS